MTTVERRRDRGDSLVEIVFTVVIVGITVSALVSGLATAANAAGAQHDSVIADTTLRNLAERAKTAARTCTPDAPLAIDATPPDGWSTAVDPTDPRCPTTTATTTLVLTATSPSGQEWTLDVVVRSP